MAITAPELLADRHALDAFDCGEYVLNEWLKKRGRANQVEGASRTFVICDDDEVVGYYSLAAGSVEVSGLPGRFRRNMPDPVPIVLLGRLAIHSSCKGRGLGRALFSDAARRILQAADTIGIRGIAVHPISEAAREFYRAFDFLDCPGNPDTMVATLRDVRAVLANLSR